MKILTSISIISSPAGKKISYTYSEVDESGNITKGNVRESFIALETDLLTDINNLEKKINERLL